jgi:hypothetical protein
LTSDVGEVGECGSWAIDPVVVTGPYTRAWFDVAAEEDVMVGRAEGGGDVSISQKSPVEHPNGHPEGGYGDLSPSRRLARGGSIATPRGDSQSPYRRERVLLRNESQ